jgi:3-deoxy-D-manno-octulosonic-acid transferase
MGKAMVFGPHMQNFSAIAAAFVAAKGAVRIDAAELERVVRELLDDPARRQNRAQRA